MPSTRSAIPQAARIVQAMDTSNYGARGSHHDHSSLQEEMRYGLGKSRETSRAESATAKGLGSSLGPQVSVLEHTKEKGGRETKIETIRLPLKMPVTPLKDGYPIVGADQGGELLENPRSRRGPLPSQRHSSDNAATH
eukprot:c56364_g1_i1 orf=101-514(+)